MGNLSALLFMAFSFWVPNLSRTVREDKSLYLTICFTLAVRHGLAITNAFVTPLSLSWGDLYYFHDIGMGLIPATGQPYGLFLKVLYKIFGGSFWLGEESSILAYCFSLVLLLALGELIGIKKNLKLVVFLVGCMPSPAIHTSTTFRESLQCLGLTTALFSLIKLRVWPSPFWLISFMGGLAVMVLLHQGLAIYAALVALLGLPWAIQGRGSMGWVIGLMMMIAVPLIAPKLISRLSDESSSARAFSEGRLMKYAAQYRVGIGSARSDYGVKLDPTDLVSFITSVGLTVILYFLAPLPWQITDPIDIYALVENATRVLLILGSLRFIWRSPREQQARQLVILASAILLECLWALGTTNWGTALRHHCVAWGLLALLGAPAYAVFTLDPDLNALLRRRERRKSLAGLS